MLEAEGVTCPVDDIVQSKWENKGSGNDLMVYLADGSRQTEQGRQETILMDVTKDVTECHTCDLG